MKKRGTYREYLRSPEWRELRRRKFADAGRVCADCGVRFGLVVHHKFYRKDLLETLLSDLVVLCENCHNDRHRKKPKRCKIKKKRKTPRSFRTRKFVIKPKTYVFKPKIIRRPAFPLDSQK